MLKQWWFWVDTKTNFAFMLYQQTQHVESTLTGKYRRISTSFWRDLLMYFDRRMVDVILMYFFDIISMNGKSTQLQRASFNVF